MADDFILRCKLETLVIEAKGMEAENQTCIQEGQAPTYGYKEFDQVQNEIKKLAEDYHYTDNLCKCEGLCS